MSKRKQLVSSSRPEKRAINSDYPFKFTRSEQVGGDENGIDDEDNNVDDDDADKDDDNDNNVDDGNDDADEDEEDKNKEDRQVDQLENDDQSEHDVMVDSEGGDDKLHSFKQPEKQFIKSKSMSSRKKESGAGFIENIYLENFM